MDEISSGRRLLLINLPNIFLFAFLAYNSLVAPAPLETARPAEGASSLGEEGSGKVKEVDSRLWQDPITAIKNDGPKGGPAPAPIFLGKEGLSPESPKGPSDFPDSDDLILFVTLNGAPYAEAFEERLRTRYAVITALLRSGYQPTNLGDLKLVPVNPWDGPAPLLPDPAKATNLIYEKFTAFSTDFRPYDLQGISVTVKKPYTHIHVFYLDERDIRIISPQENVLEVIKKLLDGLLPGVASKKAEERARVVVIGPTNSDLFRDLTRSLMEEEKKASAELAEQRTPLPYKRLDFYSPQPTASPKVLNKLLVDDQAVSKREKLPWYDPSCADRPGGYLQESMEGPLGFPTEMANIYRSNGDDSQAVSELLRELQLRKIRVTDLEHPIALITEADGLYGRALQGEFRRQAKALAAQELFGNGVKNNEDINSSWKKYKSDLKGLDEPDREVFQKCQNEFEKDESDYDTNSLQEMYDELFDASNVSKTAKATEERNLLFNLELTKRADRLIDEAIGLEKSGDVQSPADLKENLAKAKHKRHVAYVLLTDSGLLELKVNLKIFTYLRGIDGILPGSQPTPSHSKDAAKDEPEEEPAGTAQNDYIRRLAAKLKEGEILYQSSIGARTHFSAIGVTGSDVYDKLLIIRALRKEFTSALFFTTDLDATYARPEEIQYTRGLITTSRYGLEPGPYPFLVPPADSTSASPKPPPVRLANIPGTPLPFRNSYQTAIFESCCRAVLYADKDPKADFPLPAPEIYQLGRTGFLALKSSSPGYASKRSTVSGPIDASLDPNQDLYTLVSWFLCALAGLVLFSTILWKDDIHAHGLRCLAFVIVIFLLLGAGYIADRPDEQPFYVWEGISSWPTTILRFISIPLSLFFLVLVTRTGLKKNRQAREFGRRIWRILGMTILFGLYVRLIWLLFEIPSDPTRGEISRTIYFLGLVGSILASALLAFYIADTLKLCHALLAWTKKRMEQAKDALAKLEGYTPNPSDNDGVFRRRDVILNKMISLAKGSASRTKTMGEVIYYPFVVLLFMLFARDSGFERYDWPTFLMFVIPVPYLMLCLLFWNMRREAENIRKLAVDAVEKALARCEIDVRKIHHKLPSEARILMKKSFQAEKEILLKEKDYFEKLDVGAYSSFFSSPIFASILIPLGGFSALQAVQVLGHYLGSQ